ncbi:MAG: hypothetical protein ABJ092_10615 [Gillisia sp.]
MDQHKKNIALQNCNHLQIGDLIKLIENGNITLPEFIQAGLTNTKVQELQAKIKQVESDQKRESDRLEKEKMEEENRRNLLESRRQLIDQILRKQIGAEKIKRAIEADFISFNDLEAAGLNKTIITSLKHFCKTKSVTKRTTIEDLPAMEEARTDLYFVGVPGSGKSTMLAGLLKTATEDGKLLPDPYNNAGSIYQSNLITDLNRGVLPNATIAGSYNYVALSLKDENGKKHPFNIVEIPGENYVNMFNNAEVEGILRYIKNDNKKILVFVIDSLAHDNNYSDSESPLDQNQAYTNILQMFKQNGILEKTDAIYLVANKFDTIIENYYAHDGRQYGDLGVEFLNKNFLHFIENCKTARDESRNQFRIKILPFSIGNVVYNNIIESFNKDFSNSFMNLVIHDSFVVKGGVSKVLQTK